MNRIAEGITVALFTLTVSSAETRASMRSMWNRFCAWAVDAETWGAAIALLALGVAVVWTVASSANLRATGEGLGVRLTPSINSFLWVICWTALFAYVGLFFAARDSTIAAAIALLLCAACLIRLVRMAQNTRTMFLM